MSGFIGFQSHIINIHILLLLGLPFSPLAYFPLTLLIPCCENSSNSISPHTEILHLPNTKMSLIHIYAFPLLS